MQAMAKAGKKRKNFSYERKLELTAYRFLAPAAILLIFFCILPMLASFWFSLQQMGVNLETAKFVGLKNYVKAFGDRKFIQSIVLTLRFTAMEVPLQMIAGLLFSALLTKNTFLNKIFRGIFFLPMIASAVTVGIMWQLTLHSNIGLFTYWLKCLGANNPNYLNNPDTALTAVMCIAVWKTFGISTMILISAMQNVPDSLYEAAEIDGAGKIRQFFSVTIPEIMPQFWFLLMTRIIGSLQVFDTIYTLTRGGPNRATTTMVVYIFDKAFNSLNQMGYATAMSEILFFMLLILTAIQYFFMNKTSD